MSESNVRRLPVYVVLDCSGSMTGEPMESVRQGLKALVADLRNDPTALETVALSVITFASGAQQVCPLTDLAAFQEPTLQAGGSTHMGAALALVMEKLNTEVVRGTPDRKGDYRPLVFIMTDGQPTDDWEENAAALKNARIGNVIACAAGPGANADCLKKITETVVQLSNLQPDQLRSFFKWVSGSVKTTSQAICRAPAGGAPVGLPALPQGIVIVP